MIRYSITFAALLSACTAIQQTTDQAGRDAAKTIMPQTLAVYFPEVPKDLYPAFTDCVVDNARASEVQSLSGDAVVGIDPNTADTVRGILARPEAQECLRQRSASLDVASPVITGG